MRRFYESLIKASDSNLDIPCYTLALSTFKGVRVCEYKEQFAHFPLSEREKFKFIVEQTGLPCYVIPSCIENSCYCLTFKGAKSKATVKYGHRWVPPGIEGITKGGYVVLVEGFKDTFLLRLKNITCVPLLTHFPTKELMHYLHSIYCKVIYVPDNDDTQKKSLNSFRKVFHSPRDFTFDLQHCKDFGEILETKSVRGIEMDYLRLLEILI